MNDTPPRPEDVPPAALPVAVPSETLPRKPFVARAFSLSIGQALRLFVISTLVGFFVLAFDYAPGATTFDIGGAFTAIIHRAFTAIGWALESFWKPALAGAVVVLPIWAIWRLARMPFRK
ncbi:MAG: hypothetical protein WEA77_06670 [Hyphomonas sp.]|uniref:hypothetical protein n=1 Tax=Hyphomonas sp. TaxID=87 RepID=UPI0034A0A81E